MIWSELQISQLRLLFLRNFTFLSVFHYVFYGVINAIHIWYLENLKFLLLSIFTNHLKIQIDFLLVCFYLKWFNFMYLRLCWYKSNVICISLIFCLNIIYKFYICYVVCLLTNNMHVAIFLIVKKNHIKT